MNIHIVGFSEQTDQENSWPVKAFKDYKLAEDFIIEMNRMCKADYFFIYDDAVEFNELSDVAKFK